MAYARVAARTGGGYTHSQQIMTRRDTVG